MTTPRSLPWRHINAFAVVAFALAWVFAIPLWVGQGLESPYFLPVSLAIMTTPTIAALLVARTGKRSQSLPAALGLVPVLPIGRLLKFLTLGLFLPIILCVTGLFIGSLIGVFPADFTNLSGFEQVTRFQLLTTGITDLPMPIKAMAALQFVNVIIAALFINILPALAEEIGWRGWLLPRLMPLGPVPAIAISGVLWGLWHAPLILLGYNYPGTPGALALLAMVAFCTVMGGIFGWLRLRGGSVWPAALAHSSLNASATLYVLFFAEGTSFNPLHANITGWSGWIIPAALLIVIVTTSRFESAQIITPEAE